MAIINYTRDEPVIAPVKTGPAKTTASTLTIARYTETGNREVPFLNKTRFSPRTISKFKRDPGKILWGVTKDIPTLPPYGDNAADRLATALTKESTVESWYGYNSIYMNYLKGTTRNKALTRFGQEMLADLPTSSLGVTVIEGRASLQMIGNRFGNMAAAILEARRGNFRDAGRRLKDAFRLIPKRDQDRALDDLRKHYLRTGQKHKLKNLSFERSFLDAVSSGWLEYWLGWAPFTNDVAKLIDVLGSSAEKLSTEGIILKASATTQAEWDSASLTYPYLRLLKAIGTSETRVTFTGRVVVGNMDQFLNRRAGLTNLPAVIWAGVPFSFIFDWFVDVGSMLELLDVFKGVKWVSGCESTRTRAEIEEAWEYRASNGGLWTAGIQTKSEAFQYRRVVLTVAPAQSYFPKVKDLSKIFDGKEHRAATLVSLLTQVLINKSHKRDQQLLAQTKANLE